VIGAVFWRSCGRLALNSAAFLAALAGVSTAIRARLPFPEVPEVQAKIEHLRRHAAEYDTIFFGSSRIYHQILPSMFDELTAAHGITTHSFNAAIDGMRPPELNYYCDQVLRIRPQGWRWVFVEAGAMSVELDKDKAGTVRSDYWHDWKRLRWLWAGTYEMRKKHRSWRKTWESLQEPMGDFLAHLPPFARTFTNFGRGTVLTDSLESTKPKKIAWSNLGDKGDGFNLTGRGEQISAEDKATLEASLVARKAKPATEVHGDPVSQASFEDLLKGFEKGGAKTAVVIPPTTGYRKFHLLSEKTSGRLLFDYSDVDKYAPLFEVRYRLDTDHLNTAGAEVFTRIFAEEFCAAAHPGS
jgi:hypothetical protein